MVNQKQRDTACPSDALPSIVSFRAGLVGSVSQHWRQTRVFETLELATQREMLAQTLLAGGKRSTLPCVEHYHHIHSSATQHLVNNSHSGFDVRWNLVHPPCDTDTAQDSQNQLVHSVYLVQ
ncbi:hypothetical protein BaRGS_00033590 [Batillaria attramentaria]|uniref:Uncharacterized protein n=1 Tax=Batillaria attramentaria TaxID=370345 RepID=A0ABD0JJQ5_9CAEN